MFIHVHWSVCFIFPCIHQQNLHHKAHKKLHVVEPPAPPVPQPKQLGLADQVEQLRSSILSKVDAIRELQAKLRTTYVPLSVCTYLTQCIKNTDVRDVDLQGWINHLPIHNSGAPL